MPLHSVLNYVKTEIISTNTPISNHALPPLPQIPNSGNSNVHNYVLRAQHLFSDIGKGRGLIYLDTWLLH